MSARNFDNIPKRLADRLKAFGACDPELVHDTHLAQIWKVRQRDGSLAALKLYHLDDMGGEAPGVNFLKSANGHIAVDILAMTEDCLLMPWLVGESLGDVARAGDVSKADHHLVEAMVWLHEAVPAELEGMQSLESRFSSLFSLKYAWRCPREVKDPMQHATRLAQALLSQDTQARALHGDLHHDNVIQTQGGAKVIDAKGIYGAIGFELANAFRNPKGTRDAIMDPDRARALAKRSPDALGITPRTQLLWACAKCALSVAWRTDGTLTDYDADIDVLTMLLALVGDA